MNILLIDFKVNRNIIPLEEKINIPTRSIIHNIAKNKSIYQTLFNEGYSYGLELIKSYALKNSDSNFYTLNNYDEIENVNYKNIDIIGISLRFAYCLTIDIIKNKIQILRDKYPSAILVAGGNEAFVNKEILIPYFDAVCIGDGEIPFTELINAKDKLEYLKQTPYWYTSNKTELLAYINELDSLEPVSKNIINTLGDSICLMMSRGCTNNCVHCAAFFPRNRGYQLPSLDKALKDLNYYIQNGVKNIYFLDDMPFVNTSFWKNILQYLIDNNVRAYFMHVDFNLVDEELIALYKKVSISNTITFSIDAPTEEKYKLVGKKGNFKKLEKIISICDKYDLIVLGNIIVGYPWDDVSYIKNIESIKKRLSDIGFARIVIFPLAIIKGTQVYNMALENNLIGKNNQFMIEDSLFIKKYYDVGLLKDSDLNFFWKNF